MSPAQLLIVATMLALSLFGLPGFWLGWYCGRRALRTTLATEPPEHPAWRPAEADTTPLPAAGRFPVEPALLWSERTAAGVGLVREVHDMAVAAELYERELLDRQDTWLASPGQLRQLGHLADEAEALIPPRWRR